LVVKVQVSQAFLCLSAALAYIDMMIPLPAAFRQDLLPGHRFPLAEARQQLVCILLEKVLPAANMSRKIQEGEAPSWTRVPEVNFLANSRDL
jgi:hypothetical protein